MAEAQGWAERAAEAARAAGQGSSVGDEASEHPSLEDLSDAGEGLPTAEFAAAVLTHAEGCMACAAHVADVEAVIEALHLTQGASMPSAVAERLFAVVAQEAAVRSAAEENSGDEALSRLEERTAMGTFGANTPRTIDARGLGLMPAGGTELSETEPIG